MANKIFIKATEVYEATNKRLQNDIEITGATITHTNGRITAIAFGGGGGGASAALQSPDGSQWQLTVNNSGALITTKL